jgi:hypothetical protein
MTAVDAEGQELEAPYSVPTHLDTQESIGPIPHRVAAVAAGAWVTSSMLLTAVQSGDQVLHTLAMVGPMVALAPFGAWWLKPPPEHGLVTALRHWLRPKLLDPDQLRSYSRMRVEDGAVFTGQGSNCLAVWRLPTVNLDVASTAAKRRHRGQWGAFLDAIGHRVTIVIRASRLRRLQAVYEVFEHGSPEAKQLARWMQGHVGDRPLISRERLLVIPAPDRASLLSRCDDIRSSMRQFDWVPVEPESDHDLEQLVNSFWPKRPATERLGPSMVVRKSGDLVVDGEYIRTYALGFPATILTDWWSHLTDSDLPVDVGLDIEPLDVGRAKAHLYRREIGLATSRPSREREVAMEQLHGLAMAMERSQVKPFEVAITLAIRASTRDELEHLDRRLRQRVRDRGNAKLQQLTWEEMEGFERVAPLGHLALPGRTRKLETGTLARTTPLASSTLQIERGVPFGEAGNAPVLFTTRGPQKNAHLAIYGGSGAGKGYSVKVLKSREHFQHDVAVWGIDADEEHEYSGRFCRYLRGEAPKVHSVAEVDQVPIGRNSRVVIWDLSKCPDHEYGPTVARIVDRFVEFVQTHTVQADFIVDEVVNVLQQPIAAKRLTDLIQRGRHWDVGVVLITQLVSDFFGNELGRRAHRLCDSFITFQQNPAEVDDAASVLRLTAEEKTKLEGAAAGQGLLVTLNGTRRCWIDIYEKTSPEEHAMAHTTPRTKHTLRRRVRYIEAAMAATNGHAETKLEELTGVV